MVILWTICRMHFGELFITIVRSMRSLNTKCAQVEKIHCVDGSKLYQQIHYLLTPSFTSWCCRSYPIYEHFSNINSLEICVGGFKQNNNESYNQLIWKITVKIVQCGSKVQCSAVYNEGTISLLHVMSALGLSLGPAAHAYKEDA